MSGQHAAWTPAQFEQALRALGSRYHIHHPFQVMMGEGKLSKKAIQGWVANRFYYQLNIPHKDAYLMANCPDRAVRRRWIQRIIDHDGREGDEGGIECWIRMAVACGLTREEVVSLEHVLPGVRFAVDAYRNFVRDAEWHEGICSSLTELFAPTAHRQRLATWPEQYPWIEPQGLEYFRNRLAEAHRDVEHGLAVTLAHFTTRALQDRALEILQFKLDVLWSILDAMHLAYVLAMPPYFNER
ncbi:MAG: pyrroloquinoline-quinone synthase PqqC [Gammaproteobacteria bacterium]|nr:pyrroloquinoline-quinone synthase PqqC [Gammaproteobacteria bacterium]